MKRKLSTTLLTLILLLTVLPTKPIIAQAPSLVQSINIHFSEDVFVVLTNVYEFYAPFGHRMSIYMGEGGSVRFMGADAPYGLYTGRTYFFDELTIGGSAVSFNLGWCNSTSRLVWADYMGLIGGTYEWVAQIMLNRYISFEAHAAALQQHGRYSLFRHTWQQDTGTTEPQAPILEAPRITEVTIRPPDIFEDDDLLITLTYVYDHIGRADIATQTARWFYLAPNGTISFNRNIELSSMFGGGERFETIYLVAGEVFSMQGHENVSFYYGSFPVYGHHYATERQLHFTFRLPDQNMMPLLPGYYSHNDRVSDFAVNIALSPTNNEPTGDARVLRFAIDNTTFTDNGVNYTLEAAPFIAQDRTMVPLRVIGEALGATDLDLTDGIVTFNINGQAFSMTINQPLPNDMGTPVIVADRTFVPIVFIIEEMGALARWCGDARAAYIYIG